MKQQCFHKCDLSVFTEENFSETSKNESANFSGELDTLVKLQYARGEVGEKEDSWRRVL